ncbi:MAG TPA: citramalate synthase [Kiritimatiellia bacterium]|nr:citramalate synthase [Kiritimatiellia bacterium]HOM58805.1 citramalate synthase [Kiritimatiellia bacterium]HOR98587.1 citramalate synthase [Kiritimatiellia bacterium]HPK37784.1 citramalate synthase [Kiritimatiellia bacterium]HPW75910.1 citramalate synthase [Kiritimatiellia bacterium]
MEKIFLYDTTLRDGAQGEGISFSDTAKVRFARLLDDFGIDYIEGGFAGSNPRDRKFFEDIRRERLSHARITAFGSTRRVNLDAASDPQIAGLLAADTEWVTIYGKAWLLHVRDVLRATGPQNLQIIADTVGHLRQNGRQVFFDAEHFFDGYKDDPAYALQALDAAVREGAAAIVLCDTNGGTLPHEIFTITGEVCAAFPGVEVGIHTHNDSNLAVAATLEGVRGGARQVQGSVNGYGERAGNANLISILPALELKMGYACVGPERLKKLCEVSRITDDLANQRPDPKQPYVGRSAFSHKAGAHVNAIQKNPRTFEHIAPEAVGNSRHVLVSELAGVANVQIKAAELGIDLAALDRSQIREILNEIKSRENKGYSYESADGSFKILLQKVLNTHKPFFELEGFRVIVEKRGSGEPCLSEATVKVKVRGETELTAGEGLGPVDALNAALRHALNRFYPEIEQITLTDYRVRILDPQEATRAVTRVLIESGDGTRHWGTVGVSENIIEASWQALLDSVEYKLYEDRAIQIPPAP